MTGRCMVAGVGVVAMCGSLLWAQGGGGGGPPPAMVRLDAVRMEAVEQKRDVTGEIRAVQRSKLATKEPGLVTVLSVEPGDTVKAGQVIASLDDTLLRLEVAQREGDIAAGGAMVKEREAQLTKALRDLKLLQELMTSEGATQNELEDAQTTVAAAEARVANAKADLGVKDSEMRWTRQRLSDMTIRSPINGRVVSKQTEVGQWVREGDTVAEVVGLDEVDAWVDVPERYIGLLSTAGAKVELHLLAIDRRIEAPVSAVISDGDRLARTFPVRMRLANADALIRPGMSVVGKVPTGAVEQALTVHKDAVLRSDTGAYVYFSDNGKAAIAPVVPVFGVGNRLVVTSPILKQGMAVVIEGNERIYFPGQPLMDADAPPLQGVPPAAAPPPADQSQKKSAGSKESR